MHSIEEFLLRSRGAGADDLAGLASAAAPLVKAADATIYVLDYQRTHLRSLPSPGAQPVELTVRGSLAGRCYATGQPQYTADGQRWWVPLSDGARRLGVLEVSGEHPDPVAAQRLADLLALLITSRQSYSDLVERTRRRLPMQLAAEVVWNLLPPVTVETDALTVSGILEPCYEVGGDAFDYAVNAGVAHFAIFDAMGHGMPATLQATVAVNAYRNARRTGLDLVDTYHSIDSWLRRTCPGTFVTAVLAELDTRTGALAYLTAGHPAPLLLRGGRPVRTLVAPTGMPLGLEDDRIRLEHEQLEPGDRLLCFTDGLIEARDNGGVFFGLQRLTDFVGRALTDEVSLAETMHRLVQAILEHQHDQLQDDASAMLVHWHPGGPDPS